jgi:hypothetical protein
MATKARLVERLYSKAEVVQIAALLARCDPAGAPELAIYWHKIEQGPAGAKLDQSERILAALDRAAERFAVEAKRPVEIDDAQDEVIDFANADHRMPETIR